MGEASLTICMTKAWLSFASLFLESIVTSAAGEISDSVVGINYPAESRIRVIRLFLQSSMCFKRLSYSLQMLW